MVQVKMRCFMVQTTKLLSVYSTIANVQINCAEKKNAENKCANNGENIKFVVGIKLSLFLMNSKSIIYFISSANKKFDESFVYLHLIVTLNHCFLQYIANLLITCYLQHFQIHEPFVIFSR